MSQKEIADNYLVKEKDLWCRYGKVYVPEEANNLRTRILVVAHAGASGNRRQDTTWKILSSLVYWPTMKTDFKKMLTQCLLCSKLQLKNDPAAPRQGPKRKGTRRITPHGLFQLGRHHGGGRRLSQGTISMQGWIFVLRLLVPCDKYDSKATEATVVDWAALFGVPKMLITDGASHFDITLVKLFCSRFKTNHHITTAYAPWANGIIERIMRELLRLFRLMLARLICQ